MQEYYLFSARQTPPQKTTLVIEMKDLSFYLNSTYFEMCLSISVYIGVGVPILAKKLFVFIIFLLSYVRLYVITLQLVSCQCVYVFLLL